MWIFSVPWSVDVLWGIPLCGLTFGTLFFGVVNKSTPKTLFLIHSHLSLHTHNRGASFQKPPLRKNLQTPMFFLISSQCMVCRVIKQKLKIWRVKRGGDLQDTPSLFGLRLIGGQRQRVKIAQVWIWWCELLLVPWQVLAGGIHFQDTSLYNLPLPSSYHLIAFLSVTETCTCNCKSMNFCTLQKIPRKSKLTWT